MQKANNDLSTVDMLSHLNTNMSDMPATIDEHGNVNRRNQSFAHGALGQTYSQFNKMPPLHVVTSQAPAY